MFAPSASRATRCGSAIRDLVEGPAEAPQESLAAALSLTDTQTATHRSRPLHQKIYVRRAHLPVHCLRTELPWILPSQARLQPQLHAMRIRQPLPLLHPWLLHLLRNLALHTCLH